MSMHVLTVPTKPAIKISAPILRTHDRLSVLETLKCIYSMTLFQLDNFPTVQYSTARLLGHYCSFRTVYFLRHRYIYWTQPQISGRRHVYRLPTYQISRAKPSGSGYKRKMIFEQLRCCLCVIQKYKSLHVTFIRHSLKFRVVAMFIGSLHIKFHVPNPVAQVTNERRFLNSSGVVCVLYKNIRLYTLQLLDIASNFASSPCLQAPYISNFTCQTQ